MKTCLLIPLLFCSTVMATPGAWKKVGKPGEWKSTAVCAMNLDGIYSVSQTGALDLFDPRQGSFRLIADKGYHDVSFLVVAQARLLAIHKNGDLTSVNPDGTQVLVGKAGAYPSTLGAVPYLGKLITVGKDYALNLTDPESGEIKVIGLGMFKDTLFLFEGRSFMLQIQKDGCLYKIDPTKKIVPVRFGTPGSYGDTLCGTVLGKDIYTVEKSGFMYATDLTTGKYRLIGGKDFAKARFLLSSGGKMSRDDGSGFASAKGEKLYLIEKQGDLMVVDID